MGPTTMRPRWRFRRRPWTVLAAPVLVLLMAVSLAPAPAAGAAGAETHTLTVKVLDHNGKAPCFGCVTDSVEIFHDTYADTGRGLLHYMIPRDDVRDHGMGSVEVPRGLYTIITRLRDAPHTDFTSWYYMVEVEVSVEADTTVVLDAREAVLMKPPTVPETGAQVRDHTFLLAKEHATGTGRSWADWVAPIDGTNDAAGRDADVYVTPFPEPTLTGMRIVMMDRWILAEPQQMRPDPFDSDSTQLYSDTPAYMYHVPRVYTAGFDPNTLNNAYTAAEFTTVPTHYHSDYEDALIATIPIARTPQMASGSGTVVMFRPGKVLQHYLASDEVLWTNNDRIYRGKDAPRIAAGTSEAFPLAEAGTLQPAQDRHSGPVRIAVSETQGPYTDLWNSDPRSDPAMTPDLPPNFYRGGEHNERFALTSCLNDNAGGIRFYDECKATGTWSLKNLDTGLPLLPDPAKIYAAVFTGLPAEKTTYRLEHRIDDTPEAIKAYYRTQPAQHTEWTFTSAASDAQLSENFTWCAEMPNNGNDRTCQIQPLLQLRYLLDLNTWNQAPAGQRHAIAIEASYLPEAVHVGLAGPSAITDMTVEATFDDGKTWTPVEVEPLGPGQRRNCRDRMFGMQIEHPDLDQTNGFVGLRVKATDQNGTMIEQVHHRAYMLKPPGEGPAAGQEPPRQVPPSQCRALVVTGDTSGVRGGTVELAARLSPERVAEVAGKKLRFTFGDVQAEAVTNADGVATVRVPVEQSYGTHAVVASFAGDDRVPSAKSRGWFEVVWEHYFAASNGALRVNTITKELQFVSGDYMTAVKHDPGMVVETLPTGEKVIRINYTDEDLTVVGEFFPDSGRFVATVKSANGTYVLQRAI